MRWIVALCLVVFLAGTLLFRLTPDPVDPDVESNVSEWTVEGDVSGHPSMPASGDGENSAQLAGGTTDPREGLPQVSSTAMVPGRGESGDVANRSSTHSSSASENRGAELLATPGTAREGRPQRPSNVAPSAHRETQTSARNEKSQVVLQVWGEGGEKNLQEILVARSPRASRNRIHPGILSQDQVVLRNASSPMRLPAAKGSYLYWVRAAGYAWKSVLIDHQAGGERLVALSQGAADLQVNLENYYPESGAVLRINIEHERGPGFEVRPRAGQSTFLTGLKPQKYFLRVEIGEQVWNSVVLGKSEVELEESGEVTIELEDPPNLSGTIGLGGLLTIPDGWGDPDVRLEIKPLDVPKINGKNSIQVALADMQELQGGSLEWDAGLVVEGRYRIIVHPINLCQVIEVKEDEEDSEPIDLEIPPPILVRLRVVEKGTGAEVSLERLAWSYRSAELRSCQQAWEYRPSLEEAFQFLAPVGQIEVSNLFDNKWRVDRTTLVLTTETEELTVEASPSCGIRVALFDGEVPLPLSDLPRSITIRGDNPNHRVVSWSNERNAKLARVSGPDTYKVSMGPVSGFEPIPTQEILVELGELYELDIELVRIR